MENLNLNKFSRYIIVLFSVLSVFLVAKTLVEIKTFRYVGSDIYPQNTVTVEGFGEVFAVPDTATFSFSVLTEGKTAKEAQEKSSSITNAVIEELEKNGVEEKDIKTIGYNLYPKYDFARQANMDFYPPTNRTLVGYELDHTFSVKVRKADEAGKIIEVAGKMGASNISSISLTVGDDEALKREARKMAIEDAKEKAEELSKDLGVKLVKIMNFSEDGYPVFYGRGGDVAMEKAAVGQLEIAPGENQIISRIHLIYEIR